MTDSVLYPSVTPCEGRDVASECQSTTSSENEKPHSNANEQDRYHGMANDVKMW